MTNSSARMMGRMSAGLPPRLPVGTQAEARRQIDRAARRLDPTPTVWRFSYYSDRSQQVLDGHVTAKSKTAAVKLLRQKFPHVKKSVIEYHTKRSNMRHYSMA